MQLIIKISIIIALLFQFTAIHSQESKNLLFETKDEKFSVGQKWKYKTRKKEKGSLVTILKIEESLNETIIHVSITGLQIKNDRAHNGVSEHIRHLTFSKGALEKSVTKLKKMKSPLPEYKRGYKQWKNAYLDAQAGYFVIPVKEALSVIEKSTQE